jgi:hypothetical protein
MHITRVPIITFTDMKQSCSANEHHMFCLSLVLFVVCLFLKTPLFGLKQVLSNFQFFTQSAFYDVDATSAENVALVTVTSRKQHAVFGKVIICPCYCIVFP